MAPRQPRGEETVERLLTAALDVFASRGTGGFTVTAVTAASGVSLGSLYHHFGTFDGLAAVLYERCLMRLLDRLVPAVEQADGAAAGIRAAVVGYLGFVRDEPAAARVIHLSGFAPRTPEQAAALARAKAVRLDRLMAWLGPHTSAGRIVDLPAPLVEMLLIGPPAELARRWLAAGAQTGADPGGDLAAAIELLPERVWQSLRGPQG
ncbi:regulatory protein, tetR family [Parafrankia irregularis]|uniref:Regulatory protein, tetR family n=1 Tax=Parafrankia irregularis TaxID=795642 RepID=A0A0S4QN81_9ACTN|nr:MULTISPECIES: TetR/AcrR family transcriptional regulator [Parafrankia]MBE3200567.1 TetR/AcrR family transcriptional regulator [Parafrankia sp. CH37]CUU56899.1 regulatory protein, tetR family [Parafrankia irregularis]